MMCELINMAAMEARRGHRSGDPVVTDGCLASKRKTLNQCWFNV